MASNNQAGTPPKKQQQAKKSKPTRSRFAQNRIAYTVYGNPKAAGDLLYGYGYQIPQNIHDLVEAMRQLVRKKGRKAIKDLVNIHPDKQLILKLNKEQEDSYCGVCSNYSYNPADNYCGICGHTNYTGSPDVGGYIGWLAGMSAADLENRYQEALKQSNQQPDDTTLAEELHLIWNEIRKRKVSEQEDKQKKKNSPEAGRLLFIGVTLVAGILIGSAIKRKSHG